MHPLNLQQLLILSFMRMPSGARPSFPAVHRQVLVWLFQDVVLWLIASNQIAHFRPRRI
jgi:hypothetical protein